jgi:hypothetical protein
MPDKIRDSAEKLFVRVRSLVGTSKENLLTECFASVLQADARAASEYWRRVTRGRPDLFGLKGNVRVATQQSFAARSARIDMIVQRAGRTVGVEHKIGSPEGNSQLKRYVSLPRAEAAAIAFVSQDYRVVAADVLRVRRYLRPSGRQPHFVWSQFYPLVETSAHRGSVLAAATLRLMEDFGLRPFHPLIGDVRQAASDARLRKWYEPLVRSLRKRGWEYVRSSIRDTRKSEFWIEVGPSDTLDVVRLDPFSEPTSLLVVLKADSKRKRDAMLERLTRARRSWPRTMSEPVAERRPPTTNGYDWAINVRIAWEPLLRGLSKSSADERAPKAIRRSILTLMKAAAPDAV